MDRVSQMPVEYLYTDRPRSYRVLAEKSKVFHSTLYHRDWRRKSKETKAQRQQYLNPKEEKAIVKFLLLMSDFGQPVRTKFLPSLALNIARRRSTINKSVKPPEKN